MKRHLLSLLIVIAIAATGSTASGQPFSLEKPAPTPRGDAAFMLRVEESVVPFSVIAAFVMPGETLPLDVLFPDGRDRFVAHAESGDLRAVPGRPAWRWTAPETPGLVPLVVENTDTGTRIRVHAFVLTPFDHKSDRIGAYRIGAYNARPLRRNPVYRRPQGFVRVTRENRNVRLSPHFRLEQFLSKQVDRTQTFPQYVLVRIPLLLKLEMVVERVQDAGFDIETLHVMSGFRTPYYNRLIGNTTSYSRHLYGGAADIFVDADGNDLMDDLTGDGRVTKADARALANLVESMRDEPWYDPLVGGLGIYGPAPHRGPFVHIDTRGRPARW